MVRDMNMKLRKSSSRIDDDFRQAGGTSSSAASLSKLDCPYAKDRMYSDDEKKPRSLPLSKVNWEVYMKSGPNAVIFWLGIMVVTILLFTEDTKTINYSDKRSLASIRDPPHRIVFPETQIAGQNSAKKMEKKFRRNLQRLPLEAFKQGDYGGLSFETFDSKDEIDQLEQYRAQFLSEIDDTESPKYAPNEDKEDTVEVCRQPSWTGYSFPSCNGVHELTVGRVYGLENVQDFNVTYLNSGTYRDAWRFRRGGYDHLVLKRMMLVKKHTWGPKDLFKIHREANILERLAPSPRVLDIYGACGTSILMEAMASDLHKKIIHDDGFASQKELDKLDDVKVFNEFTTSEKLQIALDMAESLADLHGYVGGPITHADTHIEQWLIAPDGSVKLNDFNNAHEPEWNDKKGEYCLGKAHYGGIYRSPEEFTGQPQDESMDTFAYGNNVYTLLTGLWPFYNDEYNRVSHRKIRDRIIAGERPFVDDRFRKRSYIERKLIQIMEKCWAQERTDRPPMFEVVQFLRNVKTKAAKIGELKQSNLIKIPKPERL